MPFVVPHDASIDEWHEPPELTVDRTEPDTRTLWHPDGYPLLTVSDRPPIGFQPTRKRERTIHLR